MRDGNARGSDGIGDVNRRATTEEVQKTAGLVVQFASCGFDASLAGKTLADLTIKRGKPPTILTPPRS